MKIPIAPKSTRLEQNFRFLLAHCVTKSGRRGNDALHGNQGPRRLIFGDPLLDLGALVASWPDEQGNSPLGSGSGVLDGLPSAREMIEHYGARSERNLDAIDWYVVLACYRLGIILEGTHARACAGRADREIGDLLHATTVGLFRRALTYL